MNADLTTQGKVLLVDDDPNIIDLCYPALTEFRVSTACNYNEARLIISKNFIDVAVIDLNLNDEKDGIDLAHFIKSHNINSQIIILTAYPNQETMGDSIKLDVYSYLTKPIELTTLREEVTNAYEKKKNLDEIANLESLLLVTCNTCFESIASVSEKESTEVINSLQTLIEDVKNSRKNTFMRLHKVRQNLKQAIKSFKRTPVDYSKIEKQQE